MFCCPTKCEASKRAMGSPWACVVFCRPSKYEVSKRAPCGLLLAKGKREAAWYKTVTLR